MEMALPEVEEWQIDMEFQGWVADTSTSMVCEYVQIPGVEERQIDMEFQGWDCLSFKVADTSTSMVRKYVQIPGVEEWQIDMESQCFIPWTGTLLIMITTHR